MSSELLFCPFCGEKPYGFVETDYAGERKAYAVACRTKECHGVTWALGYGQFSTKELAALAWNTRATAPQKEIK